MSALATSYQLRMSIVVIHETVTSSSIDSMGSFLLQLGIQVRNKGEAGRSVRCRYQEVLSIGRYIKGLGGLDHIFEMEERSRVPERNFVSLLVDVHCHYVVLKRVMIK